MEFWIDVVIAVAVVFPKYIRHIDGRLGLVVAVGSKSQGGCSGREYAYAFERTNLIN